MRTQPQTVIARLQADNSRLAKEAILAEAMNEGLDEFFEGLQMALSPFVTFGVKQVPESQADGQGLSWANFRELAQALQNRSLTGHAARDPSNWPWTWPPRINGTFGTNPFCKRTCGQDLERSL